MGLWKKNQLPVTLEEAVEGFSLTTGLSPKEQGE
jgi:hypothetical protein